jgi:hypothetical protein
MLHSLIVNAFGSVARGEAGPQSDIDVIITSKTGVPFSLSTSGAFRICSSGVSVVTPIRSFDRRLARHRICATR